MTATQNPIAAIALALKTHGILPADFNLATIENEYALMDALRKHTKTAQVKSFGEGIGDDNEADEDYVVFLQRFSEASGGAIAYDSITSEMDADTVILRFQSGGQDHRWSFEQEGDRLSEDFLDQVIEHSQSCEAGEFINLQDENSILIGFVPKAIAKLLYEHDLIG